MLEFDVEKKPPRILYIGSGQSNPGLFYLQGLSDAGYNIYHVGENSRFFNTVNLPKKPYMVSTQTGNNHVMIREFSLKSLLDIVGYDFDAIIHVQDWLYFNDLEKSPIPYYFYCTEIGYPRVPKCAWYVLCATEQILKICKANVNWAKSFIYHPHSVPIIRGRKLKYPSLKKTIQGSFAGELYSLQLYKQRREIIKYLEKNVDGFETHYLGPHKGQGVERDIESGKGILKPIKYINLLLKSKCGVNVPTVGGSNFRDIEVLTNGAMLVTMETPDLLKMGLEDGINCRTFKTKEEAAKIIQGEYNEDIAEKGWELVYYGRKWWQHHNLDVARLFRYKGYHQYKDSSKNYMEFKLIGDNLLKIPEHLEKLQSGNIVESFTIKDELIKIKPKTADKIELILQDLGMIEWSIDGHTIYHRVKELAVYMNRNDGILIPDNILEIVDTIKNKKQLRGVGIGNH